MWMYIHYLIVFCLIPWYPCIFCKVSQTYIRSKCQFWKRSYSLLLSVCLYIHLSVFMSVFLSVCLSVFSYVRISVCLYFCVYLRLYISVCLSVNIPANIDISPRVHSFNTVRMGLHLDSYALLSIHFWHSMLVLMFVCPTFSELCFHLI